MRASDQRSHSRARLTRKDLKAPDEFITLTGRVLSFATQHLQSIGISLGAVVACAIGIWGLLVYVRGIEQDAFASLWHIEGQLRSAGDTDAVPPAATGWGTGGMASMRHVAEQPSLSARFASSHCSLLSTMPFPQCAIRRMRPSFSVSTM